MSACGELALLWMFETWTCIKAAAPLGDLSAGGQAGEWYIFAGNKNHSQCTLSNASYTPISMGQELPEGGHF